MKKLVTALIIVLPLLLIVAIFAVTDITRITADIPANQIVINNKGEDGILFFDIADYKYPMFESDLGVEVLPRVARNRKYNLKITDIAGRDTDIIEKENDGSFKLNGTGLAKLTYTSVDGGYSDSVLISVSATAPMYFIPTLSDLKGNKLPLEEGDDTDYKIDLSCGKYVFGAAYSPSAMVYTDVRYESSNEQIAYFSDSKGHLNARFGGESIITMTVNGARGEIKKTIRVTVSASADTTVEGCDIEKNPRVNAIIGSSSVSFGIQTALNITAEDIALDGDNIEEISAVSVSDGDGTFAVTAKLKVPAITERSERCTLSLGEKNFTIYIDYGYRDFNVYASSNASGKGDIVILTDANSKLTVACNPHSPKIRYEWEIEDQEAIKLVSAHGDECILSANSAFGATLYITWTEFDDAGDIVASGRVERTVKSVRGYSALIFAENSQSYGLGDLAVASDKFDKDGNKVPYAHESSFGAYDKNARPADIFDMEFSVSDPSLASVSYDGAKVYVNALGNGNVTVTATWKYGKLFGVEPGSFDFYAVKGIAADSDASIRKAFKESLPVVLVDDVHLGENLFDVTPEGGRKPKYESDVMREKLLSYLGELPTSWDWKYYENMGLDRPSVYYCLDITANLYGNGHYISAQYITDMLDGTDTLYDFAVFRGPLDFVATNMTGIKLASVKGQDNIVFLIRKDGITVDNAVLKGCDDETLYYNGELNLSLLNYTGTTLEVMSDARILNSRIMNGRTVARVYGREGIDETTPLNVKKEKINVLFDGCVLQNAREFILKTGTNRLLRGNLNNPEPSLYDENGNEYGAYNSPACDSYINDEYFMKSYVLTDVTLKDSTLRTSGLVSIGIESHFSGAFLAGDLTGSILPLEGWHDLAGTSYPCVLHLVGDVNIADWKDIASVDSSTLIEADTTNPLLAFLALNISELLKTVRDFGGDLYKDIISDKDGKQTVHGGIAMYGGGKNYSIVDMSEYTGRAMKNYNVNISILTNSSDKVTAGQGVLLPLAAGENDFRFILESAN